MHLAAGHALTAIVLLAAAVAAGGPWLVLLWPAACAATLAWAYASNRPAVFGKRADGSLAWPSLLLLLPYLASVWAFFHLKRLFEGSGAAWQLVAPGLYLGRWPLDGELPGDVDLVVDVSAEFPRTRAVSGRRYRCLPTLNRWVPGEDELRALVGELADESAPMYLHCGAGKGRSATVAAGVLIARGLAPDAAAAETELRRSRPGVRLHPVQRRLVDRLQAARPVP